MLEGGDIYTGRVVHKRLRPKQHALSYGVFYLMLDLDRIDELAAKLKLFSRNRFNVFSFYDRDHGPGDGTPVLDIARHCLRDTGRPYEGRRISLLTYPRVFGYVFNPLSVFYVYAPDGALETVIYEVSNTFGERKSYVVPAGVEAGAGAGVFAQSCTKSMFVSPFANDRGGYGFRVTDPGEGALVAVLLRDTDGPLIKTHFRGDRQDFNDRSLAGLIWRYPMLTIKVIAAIHLEAAKLWLKGIPLSQRHVSPRYSIAHADGVVER